MVELRLNLLQAVHTVARDEMHQQSVHGVQQLFSVFLDPVQVGFVLVQPSFVTVKA